jgi:hypothetical protein
MVRCSECTADPSELAISIGGIAWAEKGVARKKVAASHDVEIDTQSDVVFSTKRM